MFLLDTHERFLKRCIVLLVCRVYKLLGSGSMIGQADVVAICGSSLPSIQQDICNVLLYNPAQEQTSQPG
jgi:hypothetical protein